MAAVAPRTQRTPQQQTFLNGHAKTPKVGDETMSVLEIWGAEYQENDALLIKPEGRALLEAICERERCLMQARPGRACVLFWGGVRSFFRSRAPLARVWAP